MEAYKLSVKESYQPPPPRVQKKRRRRFKWKLGSLVLLLVLGYILFSFGRVYYQIHQLNLKKSALERELHALERENRALIEKVRLVQTDAYIEKLAREELGLVKPGETIMVPAFPGDAKPLKETDKNRDIRD